MEKENAGQSLQEELENAVFRVNCEEIKLKSIEYDIPIRRFEIKAPVTLIRPSSTELHRYTVQLHLNIQDLSADEAIKLLQTLQQLDLLKHKEI